MTLKTVQRIAFYFGVLVNLAMAFLNVALAIVALLYHRDPRLSAAVAALDTIVVWLIVTFDRLLRVRQTTAESFLQEQQADTTFKQTMLAKLNSGELRSTGFSPTERPH